MKGVLEIRTMNLRLDKPESSRTNQTLVISKASLTVCPSPQTRSNPQFLIRKKSPVLNAWRFLIPRLQGPLSQTLAT